MKKCIFVVITLSVFLTGCAGAKKAAWAAGCEAGIKEAVSQMGMRPADAPIKKYCAAAAEDAAK